MLVLLFHGRRKLLLVYVYEILCVVWVPNLFG